MLGTGVVAGIRKRLRPTGRNDITIFHQFVKPPYGGGNQFLLALMGALRARGYRVGVNHISDETRAALFNSYNFDFDELRDYRSRYPGCRMVHRVDGPIGVYRGADDGTDERIATINSELADATVLQSHYSLDKHREIGVTFTNPTVIVNAPDQSVFYPGAEPLKTDKGKIGLISSSWSDNAKKGGAFYGELDQHLDFDRYTYTFVGNTKRDYQNIRVVKPLPSVQLANLLRRHNLFVTASQDDPCSNALIEALHCGLPSAYLRSGGHPELVGSAGEGFETPEEAIGAITRIASDYHHYRQAIEMPTINQVADDYLRAMNLPTRAER